MLAEKVAAALHESGRLVLGTSTKSVVKRYRKRVNANVRRLSRQRNYASFATTPAPIV
jgi:hypothetical protein